MSKKPAPLRINTGAQAPEASRSDILSVIRNDSPTAVRALSSLFAHPSPSRTLDPKHLLSLAHSIAALGLIQPVAVDIENTIIAGSHRFAALTLLATPPAQRLETLTTLCGAEHTASIKKLTQSIDELPVNPEPVDFDRIPVRILPLQHGENPDDVWLAEFAENEHRRDYTSAEVRVLAERLRALGFKFGKGRPSKGERPALPILSMAIGKSERQIQRLLAEPLPTDPPEPPRSDEKTTDVAFSRATRLLLKSLSRYQDQYAQHLSQDDKELIERLSASLQNPPIV
jgi:ParB family chromosome partitioning protein